MISIFSFFFFMISMMMFATSNGLSFDIYINYFGNCTSNCSGNSSQPYNKLATGMNSLFIQLKATNLSNSTTINIRFLSSVYLSSSLSNSQLFTNWETQLNTNLTINMMPDACYMYSDCLNESLSFMLKTENINFITTSSFSIRNIIFNAIDFNLNSSSSLVQNPCYNSSTGCCTDALFLNKSSNCYFSTYTFSRSESTPVIFIQINPNASSFVITNCSFKYFLSQKTTGYYAYLMATPQQVSGYGSSKGGGTQTTYLLNLTMTISNVTFYECYFPNGLISMIRGNSTLYFSQLNIMNYNPYIFTEASSTSSYSSFLNLMSFQGASFNLTVVSSIFFLVPNLIYSESEIVIVNCSFSLKKENITGSSSRTCSAVLSFYNANNNNYLILNSNFTFPNISISKTSYIMLKYAIIGLTNPSNLTIIDCNFTNMWLFEAELIVAKSNNSITLNGINFVNVYHSCSDVPSACTYPIFFFTSYNNITIISTNFLNFYWQLDQSLIGLVTFNTLSFTNCTFSNITSTLNAVSMMTSTNNNFIYLRSSNFSDFYIDSGFYFIQLGLYDYFKISKSVFKNVLFNEFCSLTTMQPLVIISISNSQFINMSFNSYAFGLSHNVTFSFVNSTCQNLTFSNFGFIYLPDKYTSIKINISTFSNVSSTSQGSIMYLLDLNNASVFNSYFINCSCLNQDGGVFYLNIDNNLTVINSFFIDNYAYYGGVVSAYMGNSLNFSNITFNLNTAEIDGAAFYLSSSNYVILNVGVIIGGGSITGQAGFIMMITINILNMTNYLVQNCFAYAEGGFLYAESLNIIYFGQVMMNNITSSSDAGCIFLKQSNNMTINQSQFTTVFTLLSGGFLNVKNNNRITLNLSNFINISCAKDGGFIYLESTNIFILIFTNVQNVTAYTGGFLSGSNQNLIRMTNSTLINIQSSSAGGFWLFNNNFIRISLSTIIELWSQLSNGGAVFLSGNNTLIINLTYISYVRSEDSGGLVYLYTSNNLTIVNCQMWNLTTMMNGVLAAGIFNNTLNFTSNNINIYNYLGLFYFSMQNSIFFYQNTLTISYGIYNPVVFYLNSTNNISLIQNVIMVTNTLNPSQYYFFQLLSENSLNLVNNDIQIDQCYTFLEGYDNSQITFNQTVLKQIATINLILIYLENSNLTCFQVNFKENQLSLVINAINSSIIMKGFSYNPFINNSNFFQGSNCSLLLYHGNFISKNSSLSSQIIYGQYLQLFLFDVSFFMIISKNLISSVEIYDSTIVLIKSLLAFNKGDGNGGIVKLANSTQGIIDIDNIPSVIKSTNTIWLNNKATNFGGCIYLNSSSTLDSFNQTLIYIERNHFILNKAFRGGVLAAKNLGNLQTVNNIMLKNQVVSRNTVNKSKGGVGYIDNSEIQEGLLNFDASKNNITLNSAEIGGIFYFQQCTFSYFSFYQTRFSANIANFYGNELASNSITIRFFSLEKYLDSLPKFNYDTYKNAKITSIKSGQQYPECLLMINGYDMFGSITYNTDEDFLQNLNITTSESTYSNTFQTSNYNGFLCFNGTFQRNQMPVPISSDYNLISSFPSSFLDPNEKVFGLSLEFSNCDIGERLTEIFQCTPCSKGTFSFEYQFNSVSDVCQTCTDQNFYCFGGGNYTVKPGHWRMNENAIIIYKCPNEQACIGDTRNYSDPSTEYNELYAASNCLTGYNGILCAECDANYGFLDGYLCSSCANDSYYLQVFSNLILRILFTLYLINISMNMCLSLSTEKPDISRIRGTNLLKIFINHLQILGLILNFPITFPQQLTDFSGYLLSVSPNVGEAFSVECILKKIPFTLSLQYFKLIVSGIYPSVLVLIYLFFLSVMTSCRAYFFKTTSSEKNDQSISLTTKGVLFRQGIKYRDLMATAFALVTLTCYADISKMTLAMFGCVEIGDGITPYTSVLFTDFRIDCNGEYHKMWIKKLASPILIFFLFFFPIYIILSIWKGIKNDENSLFRFKFGYFFYAYQRKYFFWDFVILLRKLLLIFINSFFFSRITETLPIYPIVLVSIMLILAYLLQVNVRPWQQADFNMINKLEELSLIVSNLSISISLLFLSYSDLNVLIAAFLLIFMLIMNVSFFIVWIKHYYSYYLKSRLKKIIPFNSPFRKKVIDLEQNSNFEKDSTKNSHVGIIQVKLKKEKFQTKSQISGQNFNVKKKNSDRTVNKGQSQKEGKHRGSEVEKLNLN